MADAPKRKSTKRGPTRAAALKALGITAEDLRALKALREASTNDAAVDAAEALAGHPLRRSEPIKVAQLSEEGREVAAQAVVRMINTDPQGALEDRQGPQPVSGSVPQTEEEPVWYMRNLRGVEVSFRLSRQGDMSKNNNRTNLKPRGSRGDIAKLESGDLKDSELQTQVAYGLVEIIPEGEALEAIRRQYTNAQQTVPAHIAALRNEYGKEYGQTNPVRMATDEEAFGIKVADLDPAVMQGKRSDKEIKRDGGIVQPGVVMEPVQNPRPGSIVSDGFLAPVQTDMSGDNDKQAAVDAKLRARQFEDRPEDNLGVKVTLEPTQKVK